MKDLMYNLTANEQHDSFIIVVVLNTRLPQDIKRRTSND